MNFLPPDKLDAIEKYFNEGRSVRETARLTDVNADTVGRYFRLLRDANPDQTEGVDPHPGNGQFVCVEHDDDWHVFYIHGDTPEWWRHVATFHTEKRARVYAEDCESWRMVVLSGDSEPVETGHLLPDEIPAPTTLPAPPPHPERAEIDEPMPKPREAADGEPAVDRAGSISEIEARQSAPAAEQPGLPRQETAEHPVDAGGVGGSPAPRPLTREEREAERERRWDEQSAQFPRRVCEICDEPLVRRRGEPPYNFKIRQTCSSEHTAALIARRRDERKAGPAAPVEVKPFNGLADQLAPVLVAAAAPSEPEPHITPPGYKDCPDCVWSGPIRDYRDHRREDHGAP